MKDYFKNEIYENDILAQMVESYGLPAGAEWQVINFGIEPSTKRKIAILKNHETDYITCAYNEELKFFRKKSKTND